MYDREELRKDLEKRHLDAFDVEETPLVDMLYSITRPTKSKAAKPGAPKTAAERREAARKWLEATPPAPLPQAPKGMSRPWRGPRPEQPQNVRRARGS